MTLRSRMFYMFGIFLAAISSNCGTPVEEGPRRITERVLLVAWDGADWKIIRPLLEKNELPTLARLIETGASGDLETIWPTLSPVIWTSVATGTSAEKHQIRGFWHPAQEDDPPPDAVEENRVEQLQALGYLEAQIEGAPEMILYRSSERKTQALWNILGLHGLTSDVVSWWVTYPAEPIRGRMVSDRYLLNNFEMTARDNDWIYETNGPLIHPLSLEDTVRHDIKISKDITEKDLKRFISGEISLSNELVMHTGVDDLRIALARDESIVNMTKRFLRQNAASLTMFHLQGIDIASHYFWKYRFPKEWNWIYPDEPVSEEERERYGRTIEEYYKLQDQRLGEILQLVDSRTTIIVCSDHGFDTGRRGHVSSVSGIHWTSAPPGILVMAGSGIRPGVNLGEAHIYDIAPTVLALLGLPPENSMEGRALEEIMTPF
jgi:predicted AlkP superfamily phosphohydrolase/phosphomutase